MKSPLLSISMTFFSLIFCGDVASADTILLKTSQESLRRVTIIDFKQGRVEALDRQDGQRRLIDVSDIALIRVDGQPDLNEAEKFRSMNDHQEAVRFYEKILVRERSAASWIRLWTQIRLMNLYALLGRTDQTIETYIDLANRIPDWAIQVAPTRKDIKSSDAQLKQSARQLIEARDRTDSAKVREAVSRFYQRLGLDQELPPARSLEATQLRDEVIDRFDQPGPWLDAWAEEKIKQNDPQAVLRVTQQLFDTSLRRHLPALFYWQGRAQLAMQNYDQAAVNFLKTCIEFPSGAYAPAAMYHAAQSASQAGRIGYATSLYQELIGLFSHSTDYRVIQLVERAIDHIQEKE